VSAPVLAPSDVVGGRVVTSSVDAPLPRGVTVGGRVARVDGTTFVLADALASLDVSLAPTAGVATAGELVVVEGTLAGTELRDARIVQRSPGRAPSPGSEASRLQADRVGASLLARARALRVIRSFFDGLGFVEVETPVRVPSPGLDAHVDAIRAGDEWLITSPELHMKRLLVGGLPRIYQVAHATRAGEHGHLHEQEFTMLEWYRAFSGMDAMVADTESLVAEVARALGAGALVTAPDGRRIDVTPPFPRLTVRDAFREHAGVADAAALARDDEDRYFQVFVDRVEPGLAALSHAVVLCEFPATQAALARPCAADPEVAERFELYVGGVELCNGFGELTDPAEQRRRFVAEQERRRRTGAPLHPIDERFLAALEEGLPPSGGNALGLDRLVALCVGESEIGRVMAFPRERL
jgi:elongation factor P--(R)-beta-lysine ligase